MMEATALNVQLAPTWCEVLAPSSPVGHSKEPVSKHSLIAAVQNGVFLRHRTKVISFCV